jgi:hypothetical protein
MRALPALEPRVAPRAGLGDVGRRLASEQCAIAYLGASVTVQREGFRPRLHELLRRRFGQGHRSVMAAVGAVRVVSAAFLTDELVIAHEPDLCLVEYTTAELIAHTPLDRTEAALEGIVAKLARAGISPCFLHLHRRRSPLRTPEVLATFERVAERHGIPSIDLASTISAAVSAGRLDDDELFRDAVHTTPVGSQLIAEAADEAIGRLAELDPSPGPIPATRALDGGFARAHIVRMDPADAGEAGSTGLFRMQRPYLEVPLGGEVRRTFDERLAGLVVLAGPQSGEIRVTHGTEVETAMIWDAACHYERFTTVEFDRMIPPGVEVGIELTETVPDYATCHRPLEPPERRNLRLIGYMLLPA